MLIKILLKKYRHLEDDDVIVAEGTELRAPNCIVPDDLVDEILEIQRQLLDAHTLRDTREFTHNILQTLACAGS